MKDDIHYKQHEDSGKSHLVTSLRHFVPRATKTHTAKSEQVWAIE